MSEERYLSESALQDLISDGVSLASLDRFAATAKTLTELNADAAKPVPVDMEALVGLDVCLGSMKMCGKLAKVEENLGGVVWYVCEDNTDGQYCRPRPDYWHHWRNFKSYNDFVDKMSELAAAGFAFALAQGESARFEAFQIKGPAEGRCWREDAE